jgi:hypothetical protein
MELEQVLIAQPLLALRVLEMSIAHEFAEVERPARPGVAELFEPFGIFVGRSFGFEIQLVTIAGL